LLITGSLETRNQKTLKEFGEFHFRRLDVHVRWSLKEPRANTEKSATLFGWFCSVDTLDGTKLVLRRELILASPARSHCLEFIAGGSLDQVRHMMKQGEDLAR
jgi:hypothetical protein